MESDFFFPIMLPTPGLPNLYCFAGSSLGTWTSTKALSALTWAERLSQSVFSRDLDVDGEGLELIHRSLFRVYSQDCGLLAYYLMHRWVRLPWVPWCRVLNPTPLTHFCF